MTRRLLLGAAFALLLGACGEDDATVEGDTRAHIMVATGATLLDVRTPGEFAGGHLDGAVNIPVSELSERMSEVSTDQPVVVYCQSGGRSATAATALTGAGYDVHDLGAMSNW